MRQGVWLEKATQNCDALPLPQMVAAHGSLSAPGGDSQPVKHMEREPILALTLMDGRYYTLMVAGATPEGARFTTSFQARAARSETRACR